MDTGMAMPQGSEGDLNAFHALAARVKFALKNGTNIRVPDSRIRRFEGQPREYFDPVKLQLLSESIDTVGQTTPGLVRENPKGKTDFEFIDGERRWRAIRMIPQDRRPEYDARLIKAEDDVVQFILSGITNFNREGHTPLEIMNTIDRLLKINIPLVEIAKVIGLTPGKAGQIHGLINLAPEIQDKLKPELPREKQISLSAAIHISKLPSWPHQRLVAEDVMTGKLPLADIRSRVIQVASRARLVVRVREHAPQRQWDLLGSKISTLERDLVDVSSVLARPIVKGLIKDRVPEAKRLAARLKTVQRDIDRIRITLGDSPEV